MFDNHKISTLVKMLQTELDMTNDEFGESIGVSGSYISLIKNGKREMGKKTIDELCRVYNIDPSTLQNASDSQQLKIKDSLKYLRKIRKLSLEQISDASGIPAIELSQIERGKLEPSEDHVKRLSIILEVTPEKLENGSIIKSLETIRRELISLDIGRDVIKLLMEAIEREI